MWIKAMRLQRTDHSNGELIRRFNAEIIFTTNALVTSRNHGVRNLSCTQFKCIVQEVKIVENNSHLRSFNADSWQKSSVALKTSPYTMHVENTMPIDAKIIKSKSRFPPSHAGQHTISPIKFKLICKKTSCHYLLVKTRHLKNIRQNQRISIHRICLAPIHSLHQRVESPFRCQQIYKFVLQNNQRFRNTVVR